MATRTKPLISAALASAAAVAVVSPAIVPGAGAPSPLALSKAAYTLTTVSDVLSVPRYVWTDLLFGNMDWGFLLGPSNNHVVTQYDDQGNPYNTTVRGGYGPSWAQPIPNAAGYTFTNPWGGDCAYGCSSSGISATAYLFFDALVNGNGKGYDLANGQLTNAELPWQPDPAKPDYNPYVVQPWKIGIVNYLFEPYVAGFLGGGSAPQFQLVNEGFSASAWYALRGTLGQAIPFLQTPIDAVFWGTYNLTFAYENSLRAVAYLASIVPVVGPFVGNSITAYLGELLINPSNPDEGYYQYGLSGTLNYWVDLVTGAATWPKQQAAGSGAATVLTAGAASAETAGVTDVTTEANGDDSTEAGEVEAAKSEAPESEASESEGSEVETVKSETPEAEASESTTEVEATEATETTDTTEAPVTATEVTATNLDAAPAEPKRPRPVRDAVEKVGKQINTAIANAKAAKAERVAARKAAKAGAASAE